MPEGAKNSINRFSNEGMNETGTTDDERTVENKESQLPESVIHIEGGTFEAWFAPGMRILPKEEVFPFREGMPVLAEKYSDLLDELREAEKKEVNFTQRGVDLTIDRLGYVSQLEMASKEYLYKSLQAMRGRAVSISGYQETKDKVLSLSDEVTKKLEEDRAEYRKGMIETTKVSLRDFKFVTGEDRKPVMECNYARVPYTAYTVIRDPNLPQEILDLANPTATAIIIRTKESPEEPSALAIQVRSRFNRLYPQTPGASAAGMWDARRENGKTVLPTIEEATLNATKEMSEEVGLTTEHVSKIEPTGFTIDKISYHSELTFLAELNVSAREMVNISKESKALVGQFYGFDFSESWVFIKSDLESLETFLTQARLHTPSTHAAAIMAVAVANKREELGIQGIDKPEIERQMNGYVNMIESGMKNNYAKVDLIVEEYWKERMKSEPDLKTKNLHGYDPELSPEAQGLPSVNEELSRLGLISMGIESTKREFSFPKEPKFAWMLDVDGVITDTREKIADPEVINGLVGKLSSGEPVVLNTGRSLEFVKERVLKLIEEGIPDKKMLEGVCVVGEKGGTYGYYNDEGLWEESINESLLGVGFELIQEEAKKICTETNGLLVLDDTKQTMVTLEMKDGGDTNEFANVQEKYTERLRKKLRGLSMSNTHQVDPTTIAIDVQSFAVGGKAEASVLLAELLEQKGIKPKEFICLGDSSSDTDMRRGLEDSGIYARYVDVGRADLTKEGGLMTIHTENNYTRGTANVLKSNPILL